jgi:hypothetical protein
LTRRFGRPSGEVSAFSIVLELLCVPGLRSLRLNGIDLAIDDFPGDGSFEVLLADRNTLELEVDVNQAIASPPETGWGSIALVLASGPGG